MKLSSHRMKHTNIQSPRGSGEKTGDSGQSVCLMSERFNMPYLLMSADWSKWSVNRK